MPVSSSNPQGGRRSSQGELKGMPFTVSVVFREDGYPVEVSNPKIKLFSKDNDSLIAFKSLDSSPVSPDNTEHHLVPISTVKGYSITIDPLSLPCGLYKVVFSGEMLNEDKTYVEVIGTIGIQELSRVDRILVSALACMMDNPEEYLFKPQVHQFKAYNLYKYLNQGIQFINLLPPMSTSYDIDDLPGHFEAPLVDYIVAKAVFGKARLGIENDFQVQDTRSIQQETYSKYKGMYDTLISGVKESIKEAKRMLRPAPRGFRRNKYPLHVQRIISLSPHYTNVFY